MKSKIMFLFIGIVTGLILFHLYTVVFPRAIPIGDGGYFVNGRDFVFGDPQAGVRILEKTKKGIFSRVFIPGQDLNSSLFNGVNASVMNLKQGDIVQTKGIHFNEGSTNVDIKMYRYDGEKLIRIPFFEKD